MKNLILLILFLSIAFSALSQTQPRASQIKNTPAGDIAATNVQTALNELDTEKASITYVDAVGNANGYSTLTDGATVNWDALSQRMPAAKLTSTQSFAINITNVRDASVGLLKLTTNTASAITLTFDTDFTNKTLGSVGEETILTYTFPAATAKEYILTFLADGTTLHWTIGDVNPITSVSSTGEARRAATQSLANNTNTAIIWDTEISDTGTIIDVGGGNPSRLVIPGSGNKIVWIDCLVDYASNGTGTRRIFITKNGVTTGVEVNYLQIAPHAGAISTTLTRAFQVFCAGGDYLELNAYQNSTGSLNITARINISVQSR